MYNDRKVSEDEELSKQANANTDHKFTHTRIQKTIIMGPSLP